MGYQIDLMEFSLCLLRFNGFDAHSFDMSPSFWQSLTPLHRLHKPLDYNSLSVNGAASVSTNSRKSYESTQSKKPDCFPEQQLLNTSDDVKHSTNDVRKSSLPVDSTESSSSSSGSSEGSHLPNSKMSTILLTDAPPVVVFAQDTLHSSEKVESYVGFEERILVLYG